MSNRELNNLHVSVRQRLYTVAKKRGEDFNSLLRRYFQERFLYRVSVSNYAKFFILKGAQLIIAHQIDPLRTTKDIDFLGINFPARREDISTAIREIATISYPDGVVYSLDEQRTEDILEGKAYKGVRFHLICRLGTAKSNIQIDIGFGDVITPHPDILDFPVVLPNDNPRLFVYTLESAIAEKFETIVVLGLATSRIKDYFDLCYLAKNKHFSMSRLKSAVAETFQNRNTPLTAATAILTPEIASDEELIKLWNSYLKRNPHISYLPFSEAHHIISKFLFGILENAGQQKVELFWNPDVLEWLPDFE